MALSVTIPVNPSRLLTTILEVLPFSHPRDVMLPPWLHPVSIV